MLLKCDQATFLICKKEQTPLTVSERLNLRFHLFLCTPCARFNKQILFINKKIRILFQFQPYSIGHQLTSEKKEAIQLLIEKEMLKNKGH